MKDSGIGTPATRAAIIERLIDVGYIERDARALVATDKGVNVVRLLGEHPLTSPGLTGDWEHRLDRIEHGQEQRETFMRDIAAFAVRPVAMSSLTTGAPRVLPALLFQITKPQPGSSRDQHENPLRFSTMS